MSKIVGLLLILLLSRVGVSHAQDATECESGTQAFEHERALGAPCVSQNVERYLVWVDTIVDTIRVELSLVEPKAMEQP